MVIELNVRPMNSGRLSITVKQNADGSASAIVPRQCYDRTCADFDPRAARHTQFGKAYSVTDLQFNITWHRILIHALGAGGDLGRLARNAVATDRTTLNDRFYRAPEIAVFAKVRVTHAGNFGPRFDRKIDCRGTHIDNRQRYNQSKCWLHDPSPDSYGLISFQR